MLFTKGKAKTDSRSVTEIAVEAIALNPHQPRQAFDQGRLDELAASIKEHGLIQPVVVRPVGNAYELVVGERRLRAARLAGLKKVPAVVKDVTPQEMAVLALIENLQREDLNVIEEARGYRRLAEEFKFTQSEVGRLVGKSQSTIANKLRLLKLGDAVQARILAAGVSERHARALLELPDEAAQMRMLEEVIGRGLSVRDTEERVRTVVSGLGTLVGPTVGSGVGRSELLGGLGGVASPTRGRSPRRGGALGQLGQAGDRRAIRAFRDLRLFLNTFRRAVEMLKDAGVPAQLIETDGPDFLEVKVLIPKAGAAAGADNGVGRAGSTKAAPEGRG